MGTPGARIRMVAGRYLNVGPDVRLFLAYMFLVNIGFGVYMLIFNLYVYALDFREDAIGQFSSVQTFTMAATALMLGTLVSRLGLWNVIVAGVGVYGVSSIGMAVSTTYTALMLFSAISGIGLAIIFTATMPFIIDHARREERTNVATVAFSTAALSMTLGSLIGGFAPALLTALIPSVGAEGSYRWALIAGSLLGLASILPMLRMGDARRGPSATGGATARASETPEDDVRRTRIDVGVFVVVGGVMAVGLGLVAPFYNVYLQTLGASTREIGLIYAAGGISAAVIGLFAPMVSRRMGSLNAIVLIRGSSLPIFLLLVFAPWYALAAAAHMMRQISINMAWPVDSTFISEIVPGRLRASVFGWRSAAWNVGIGLSSILGGWLIVQRGYTPSFVGYVVFTAAAITLYYLYYRRHPMVLAGEVPSALSSRQRARLAIRQTEDAVGTVDGQLPGTKPVARPPSTPNPDSL